MIPHDMTGVVYTVVVKLRRNLASCAGLGDFTTFDSMTDSYTWRPLDGGSYTLVPSEREWGFMTVTVYLQLEHETDHQQLMDLAKNILVKEFFPNVCGVAIEHVDEPQLFIRLHEFEPHPED
jgi:hypothetical protein